MFIPILIIVDYHLYTHNISENFYKFLFVKKKTIFIIFKIILKN